VFAAEDEAGVAAHLAGEPVAAGGVRQDTACRSIRIPPLPWRAWPSPEAALPPGAGIPS